jgi:uncharacterized repeat protein (TIGR03803 family)
MKFAFVKDVSVVTAPTPPPNYAVSTGDWNGSIALKPTKPWAARGLSRFKIPQLSAWLRLFAAVSVLAGVAALPAQAAVTVPVYSVLHNFDGANGYHPYAGVTIGNDGSLYGTTDGGGIHDIGTIWKINAAGVYSVLHYFDNTNGGFPTAGVTIGSDGSLYGTAQIGGIGGGSNGTIWKINAPGAFSVLHDFDGTDCSCPTAWVTISSDGSLYGTTLDGGINNVGTVWKINAAGAFSVLHDFDVTNSYSPLAGVTIGSDGSLYGTTLNGGTSDAGAVWKINPAGAFSVLHHFDGVNGGEPYAGVTIGSDGSLYGTTRQAGTNDYGTLWKINPAGGYSVLHHFDRANGYLPYAGVTIGNDGSLYGTAEEGGSGNGGVVYRLTMPSSNVPGDISGDGKVDCADIKVVKASFGKRQGQVGFNAKADVNNDKVVNIRDLVFVSRRLSSGLVC